MDKLPFERADNKEAKAKLSDSDFVLIQTLESLTDAINKLVQKLGVIK